MPQTIRLRHSSSAIRISTHESYPTGLDPSTKRAVLQSPVIRLHHVSKMNTVGVWLSLVEHTVRDRGVAGSNPVTPTFSSLTFISVSVYS
jgi:hypothetical protein